MGILGKKSQDSAPIVWWTAIFSATERYYMQGSQEEVAQKVASARQRKVWLVVDGDLLVDPFKIEWINNTRGHQNGKVIGDPRTTPLSEDIPLG